MANALTHEQLDELRRTLEAERARILRVLLATAPSAPQADQVTEVERALAKLCQDAYGVSELSGDPIPYQRLVAMPWARGAIEE